MWKTKGKENNLTKLLKQKKNQNYTEKEMVILNPNCKFI